MTGIIIALGFFAIVLFMAILILRLREIEKEILFIGREVGFLTAIQDKTFISQRRQVLENKQN